MGKEKTLYITDLDGTLLGDNARLSAYTRDTLNSLIAKGLLFSFATARSIVTASQCVAGLKLQGPVILGNGTFVSQYPSGQMYRTAAMAEEQKHVMLTLLEREQAPILSFAMIDGRERVSWIKGRENGGVKRYLQDRKGDVRLRPVETFEELGRGQVTSLTVVEEEGRTRYLKGLCEALPGYDVSLMADTYHPQDWTVSICLAGISKATGLDMLRDMLDVDKIVVFGDNLNDLPLFAAADECYAVANAKDELKAVATGVIGSNEEDGVARWLAEHGQI